MSTDPNPERYTPREELANGITHGVGILLSIGGLALLTAFAVRFGDIWHIVSCTIFGVTLVLMYTASTLYHSIPLPRVKTVLRVIDHSAIFFLIAGTYTPFTLVNLRGPWGWSLFGIVWGIALLGVAFQVTLLKRWQMASVGLYTAMGWVVVVAIKPLLASLAPAGLALLMAGGLCYTLGIVFYLRRRIPYHHAVWHLFVLGGSILHYFAILLFVIPAAR